MAETSLLEVEDLSVDYQIGHAWVGRGNAFRAVDRVSIQIQAGSVCSLVGESGSGKTSLGRTIARLQPAATGRIIFDGQDVTSQRGRELRKFRRAVQVVYQDPFSSLDPRMSIFDIIAEPLDIHGLDTGVARASRIKELMAMCGLGERLRERRPHELSGGQRQRVGIARALAVRPRFLICDEPVSALDASVQAQILNLLMDLREEMGLTYLFIAHNLGVIRHISDHVAIMYLGSIVESGPRDSVFAQPRHPYTKALLSSAPVPDPPAERRAKLDRIVLQGDIPSAANPPSGCRFHTRCWLFQQLGQPAKCTTAEPALRETNTAHTVSCHFTSEPAPVSAPSPVDLAAPAAAERS